MAIVGIFNIHIIVGIVNILDSNFQVSDIVNQIISKYYNIYFKMWYSCVHHASARVIGRSVYGHGASRTPTAKGFNTSAEPPIRFQDAAGFGNSHIVLFGHPAFPI